MNVVDYISLSPPVLYVASGLITFLAILIAYKYTLRKRYKARLEESRARENVVSRSDSDKDADSSTTEEDSKPTTTPDVPKNDEKERERDEYDVAVAEEIAGKNTHELDPKEYCDHIQGHMKKTRQRITHKKIEEGMTAEQKAKEREIQRQQLEAIFGLLAEQEEKFGVKSMDDVQDQMKLYVQ